jgi:hypothetical protein
VEIDADIGEWGHIRSEVDAFEMAISASRLSEYFRERLLLRQTKGRVSKQWSVH